MHYPGPELVNFDDVAALNRAFLELLGGESCAGQCLVDLRDDLAVRLRGLTPTELDRLAGTPFLLVSFREHDRVFWDRILDTEPRADLFAGTAAAGEASQVIAAGLSFVWQLARQNSYALRLVCGASLHWCERIAERPLVGILNRARSQDALLTLRSAADANLWRKLLYGGVSVCEDIRAAAHLGALQMMLTRSDSGMRPAWSSAACRTRVPSLGVVEDRDD